MTTSRLLGLAFAAAASLALAACDSGSPQPAPAPQPTQPAQPAGPTVQPLSQAQMTKMNATFDDARKLVEEARKHRKAGEEAGAAGNGISDAIPHYQQARPLYRRACEMVEEWIEPELGVVTEGQVEEFRRPEVRELGKWQKENMGMGKFPPKE